MLLPRVLTAIVGVPLLFGVIYFGELPFFLAVMAIVLVAQREFYFLAVETGYPCFPGIGVAGGALLLLSIFLNGVGLGPVTENQGTAFLLSLVLLVIVARSLQKGPSDTSLSEWGTTLLGIFYVAWTLGHLVLLRGLRPNGMVATYLLFVLIWTADTAAYFVGVRWGRHKIAESVSPKKTWEGTVGGVVGACAVAAIFQQTTLAKALSMQEAIGLAIVTSVLAFISDIGESLIKRGAGVKDSSLLLPGHGGLLDRFDSFILTTPFFYYYWAFTKH